MNVSIVKNCLKKMKFSSHAKEEMLYEEFGVIYEKEVIEAIESGIIIEEYLQDKPYPSCLVFGKTYSGRPLHIVCAPVMAEQTLIIITIYQPSSALWIDYKRRKGK